MKSLMRMVLLGVGFVALTGADGGCGDDDEKVGQTLRVKVELDLTFPDRAALDSTKGLLFLIGDETAAGACNSTLFDMTFAATVVGTPTPYPLPIDTFEAPRVDGRYTVYAYTYDRPIERFCTTDMDCMTATTGPKCTPIGFDRKSCTANDAGDLSPNTGGCAVSNIIVTGNNHLAITLKVAP
jgi:hypothetical protein